MQSVVGMSCRAPRGGWRMRATGGGARAAGYLKPSLAATLLVALALHLLARLGRLADPTDAAALLSVLVGMAAVVVTLAPFVMLFTTRAHSAWRGTTVPDGQAAVPAAGRR